MDSKTVISQVQEIHIILSEILAEGMMLSETFQVATIIEKLPPGWKDFKSYLKHKCKEINIEGLVVKLWIKEDNRNAEKEGVIFLAKTNVVEHGSKNKKNKKLGPKWGISKKQTKFQGKCFNCDKMGHKASDCRLPKKKREANVVENITQHVSDINLPVVVLDINRENGGLIREQPDMYAQTEDCSLLLKLLAMERSYLWGILYVWDRGLRKGGSKDDFWKKVDSERCVLCARNLKELGVWIVVE